MDLATVGLVATGAGLVLLLVCADRGLHGAAGFFKVVASTGFIAFGLGSVGYGELSSNLVLTALGFCWLGDVLLIPRGARLTFLLGLGAFLLGHAVFAICFVLGGVAAGLAAAAALGWTGVAVAVLRWLGPHVQGSMVWPVRAYVVVIGLMVIAAAGTGIPRIALGGVLFAVSDLFVARERFVTASPWNRRIGLPLYYGAVLLLAAGL